MIHTADLARSKRLKELGWEQKGLYYWHLVQYPKPEGATSWIDRQWILTHSKNPMDINGFHAPMAGEMIEWLLGENYGVYIDDAVCELCCPTKLEKIFKVESSIENALADACAWVLAKAIESQEIK